MKKLLFVVLSISICLKAYADTDVTTLANALYVEGATVNAGETATLSLQMKNEAESTISGFQGIIDLPAGATYITSTAAISPSRTAPSDFIIGVKGSSTLGVICFAPEPSTFSGTEGEVATFQITAPSTPGIYTIAVSDIVLATKLGREVLVPGTLYTTLIVLKAVPDITNTAAPAFLGDVNGDGILSLSDVTALIQYIEAGITPSPFCIEDADVDGSGNVDKEDVSALLNLIIGK